MRDIIDGVIAEAVGSMTPRPGFATELLVALRGTPALPVTNDDDYRPRFARWVVPGAFAGAVGATGIVCYGLGRKLTKSKVNKKRSG